MVQAHIVYSGMVQGVGFRYTVEDIVRQIGRLNGWVRNLQDGRVEILIEGDKKNIEQLMAAVEQRFNAYIRSKSLMYAPSQGSFKDFQITY